MPPCAVVGLRAAGECSSSTNFDSLKGTFGTLQPAGHSVPLDISYAPPAPMVQAVGSTLLLQVTACLVSTGTVTVLVPLSYLVPMRGRRSPWHDVHHQKWHHQRHSEVLAEQAGQLLCSLSCWDCGTTAVPCVRCRDFCRHRVHWTLPAWPT